MTGTTLHIGGRLPIGDAFAFAVRAGTIVWTGSDARFDGADRVVDLQGATVTPAFVDAHVHASSAGLLLTGLDLTGCRSLTECLDTVRRFAATTTAPVLWGHGWDETRWPQRRPPTRAELDDAVGGRPAYLSRVDVHSALASTALADRAAGRPGYDPDGPLSADAHHVVRRAAQDAVTPEQRRAAQLAFLDLAAANGIGEVHECAGPDISGADDLADLLAAGRDPGRPDVVGYWGELVASAERATEVLAATGAHGLAGDLFCDGAVGSRTAALCTPYADAPSSHGNGYLDAEQVAAHVVACTEVGVQAGFHVIGDAAMGAVVAGFALAERRVGRAALAARTHRLEHAEMVTAEQAALLAGWGVVASVQPMFDAHWGGTDGMYAQRLGVERAVRLNPFALYADAGVTLAFGSDTPVTALGPWAAVRAAVHHRTPGSGLTPTAAFHAHTTGGRRAAGPPRDTRAHRGPGGPANRDKPAYRGDTLGVGGPATYALWDGDGLDPRHLDHGTTPRCLRTVVRGTPVFDS